MKPLYTAVATAKGGRNGEVRTDNGVLDVTVRMPRELGGANNDHTNPEQLFAAGYAACFDSALNRVIQMSGTDTGETSVMAKISIGQIGNGAFGLAANLEINIPGVSTDEALALAEKAHQICPYSNATRNNIEVLLTVTNN